MRMHLRFRPEFQSVTGDGIHPAEGSIFCIIEKGGGRNVENKSGKKRNSVCRVLLILFASVRRLLLILLILALAAAFCIHQIHPYYFPLGITTHNAGLYEDGSYSTLAGGQAAAKFFPEKDELGEYSSIDFYFVNNVLRFTLFGRIGNTFRLDVRYSEEAAYDEAVRQLFRNYHCGDYQIAA